MKLLCERMPTTASTLKREVCEPGETSLYVFARYGKKDVATRRMLTLFTLIRFVFDVFETALTVWLM